MRNLRCRKCGFIGKNWHAMRMHLHKKHQEKSENVTQAVKNKLVMYSYAKSKSENVKVKKERSPTKKEQNSCMLQEIIIPIYLRIPIAFGNVSIIQPNIEKENK